MKRSGLRVTQHWLLLGVLLCAPLWGAERTPNDFFGEYIGSTQGDGSYNRDFRVSIAAVPDSNDFVVEWVTLMHKPDGRIKRKQYKIAFTPTERPQIYASVMRKTVFGGKASLDPLRGDPLFWARIDGDTLTVNALMIDNQGKYSIQSYHRTLTNRGLMLHFERKNEREAVIDFEAELLRVAD